MRSTNTLLPRDTGTVEGSAFFPLDTYTIDLVAIDRRDSAMRAYQSAGLR
jgi:hypothetical protein